MKRSGALPRPGRSLPGAMKERGLHISGEWAVMWAAHGTVVNPPLGVDNGLMLFARVLILVRRLLRPTSVWCGWAGSITRGAASGPRRQWGMRSTFIQARGFTNVVYFPWGFTTDNAETALEGRMALAEMSTPFERVEYLPCLNADGAFISLLADRVTECVDAPNGGTARGIGMKMAV